MVSKYSTRRIDVIFDQYMYPSIKDSERCLRHEASLIDYIISGPDQVRPSDFAKELKNTKFKEALVGFFEKHWCSEEMKSFIGNRKIHMNFRNCQSYQVVDEKIQSNINEDLCCTSHEEADTKIIYHACNVAEKSNIVIRGFDTDILIIMIGNMKNLKNSNSNIWMLNGTGNNERKEKTFLCVKKNTIFQEAFATIGDEDLTEGQLQDLFNVIQQFTCQLYNAKKSKDVDDGRFQLFVSSYKASDVHENFTKKVQHFDATSIPPCKSELYQQFLRAHYISTIWKNAYKKQPSTLEPLEYGWIEQDNTFILKWFEGDQLPSFVSDLITNIPESDSIDDEDDSYNDEHYPDDDE
ncbi:uncharacterized protein TNCV_4844301 [Trichonephila clavipes]|uniref:Uncharacterized protein n=1 Tax=Trichonephila clavipes TaxID=2585209 RepID=A0A8X6WJ43_TRICX|nr:uncharacterized protein TNCV_4844301 [Trichonephila clavipes]